MNGRAAHATRPTAPDPVSDKAGPEYSTLPAVIFGRRGRRREGRRVFFLACVCSTPRCVRVGVAAMHWQLGFMQLPGNGTIAGHHIFPPPVVGLFDADGSLVEDHAPMRLVAEYEVIAYVHAYTHERERTFAYTFMFTVACTDVVLLFWIQNLPDSFGRLVSVMFCNMLLGRIGLVLLILFLKSKLLEYKGWVA